MELEGVVNNGVIIPDGPTVLPEGMRVRISPAIAASISPPKPQPFGQRYSQFKGTIPGLPTDLAAQHDHHRLGTPKR
jgi:hypothetical protein